MTKITPNFDFDVNTLADLPRAELNEIGRKIGLKAVHLGGQSAIINKIKVAYYENLVKQTNANAAPKEDFAETEAVTLDITQERRADQPDIHSVGKTIEMQMDPDREGEVTAITGIYLPGEKTPREMEDEHIRNLTRLRRVKIAMLNPLKAELKGEIFTLHDRTVGTLRKFIPYGTKYYKNGYHIEQAFYDHLLEREYVSYSEEERTILGSSQTVPVGENLPEFEITDLPPLTLDEIRELALKQEQSKRIDAD